MTPTKENDRSATHSKDLPDSPRAMADAVVAEAVAQREKQQARLTQEENSLAVARQTENRDDAMDTNDDSSSVVPTGPKRPREQPQKHPNDTCVSTLAEAATKELKEIWRAARDEADWNEASTNEAIRTTKDVILGQIEALISQGLEIFHAHDSQGRELARTVEENASKEREIKRLRASAEQSRATISNLLRAVDSSKTDLKDASRDAEIEARLRADISSLRSSRDSVAAQANELKRKYTLLQEELRLVKAKLSRVSQEKVKIERDSRVAISLARSLDNNSSSDADFYRHKVSELTNQIQAQQTLAAEQKQQIEDLRRQIERSLSQNRLANLRAEGSRIVRN